MSLIIRRWRVPRPPPPLSRYHFNINTRSADNNAGRSSPTFRLCESPPAPAAVSPRFPPRGRAAGGGSRLTTPPPPPLSRGAIESVYHFNYREFPSQSPQFPVSLPRIVAASSARLARIISIDTGTRGSIWCASKCRPISCTRACGAVRRMKFRDVTRHDRQISPFPEGRFLGIRKIRVCAHLSTGFPLSLSPLSCVVRNLVRTYASARSRVFLFPLFTHWSIGRCFIRGDIDPRRVYTDT